MTALQPAALLAYMVALLTWNIFLGGRIGRRHEYPRVFTGMSALAGFVILPALLIFIAGGTAITGRAIQSVTWMWPAACALVTAQSVYSAITRRLQMYAGLPLVFYNVLVTLLAVAGWSMLRGAETPDGLLALSAANAQLLAWAGGEIAVSSALFVMIPLLAPAYPLRARTLRAWRVVVIAIAGVWTAVVLLRIGAGREAIQSYAELDPDGQPPNVGAPVLLGLKVFPDLAGAPPPLARQADLQLAATLQAQVIAITVEPGIRLAVLDDLRRMLAQARSDTTLVVVTLATPSGLVPRSAAWRLAEMNRRAAAAEEIARRLRPDYMFLAVDPFGAGGGALAGSSVERWQRHLEDAAAAARRGWPSVRAGVSVNAVSARDSVLHAWAVSRESTLRVAGFSFTADSKGGAGLLARMERADDWMEAAGGGKEHWLLPVAGLPMVHGAQSQDRTIGGVLGWAMEKIALRGAVVWEAGEYGSRRGLVPSGAREDSGLERLAELIGLAREGVDEDASARPAAPTEPVAM
jgi:hypothetical protein